MTTSDDGEIRRWQGWLVLLAIFLFAFGLRWYYVSHAMVLDPVRGDATQYYAYALNLSNHGIFSKDLPDATVIHPDNYRDPGYPAFLALWMKVLGAGEDWYAAVLLSQALLGALTVALAMQLGRHWLPLRWAAAASVAMALWPHSITINGYLLSETVFGFLTVLGILIAAGAFQRESMSRAVLAGLTLGAAALTNAILLPFGILLAAFLGWRKLASRRLCIALAVGAAVLPGAWAIRNAAVVVPVAGSSSTDRALQNFAQGSRPEFQTAWRDSVLGDEDAKAKAKIVFQHVDDDYAQLRTSPLHGVGAMLRRLSQHPLQSAQWYLIQKPALLWGWGIEIGQGDIFVFPTRNAPFQIQPMWIALAAICHAANTTLMLRALAAFLFVGFQRDRPERRPPTAGRAALISTLFLVAFVTFVYSTLQAEPRYSIPFRPLEILLVLTTLYGIATWWQKRKRETSDNLVIHDAPGGGE
jgi:4-amino-4-deoxy-L-arabinose transferase-like glycosyltransferase